MKTYDRDTFERASQAWADFGPEWADLRRLSWDRGFPFPPKGTRWDDREEDEPSPRAIVYRALLDRPKDTAAIVARSRSWYQVVAGILQTETRIREDVDEDERGAEWDRQERPTHRQAVMTLGAILQRIDDSR